MGRSPAGEGSVYQRKSDGLWVAAATGNDGRRRSRYGKTEKEARAKLRRLLADIDAGRPLPSGRIPTLGQYLTRWLSVRIATEVETGRLRTTTADSYEVKVRQHVLSHPIADIRLNVLTTDDVRRWQREKLRADLSPRFVGQVHAVVRRALNNAIQDGDGALARNVFGLVPVPAGQYEAVELPPEQECVKLLAEAIEDRHSVLWLSMVALGPRKGETLGMRWSRTDLDAGTTTLAKQFVREREWPPPAQGRRRGKVVERDTKTRDATTLLLPDFLVVALRAHRVAQAKRRLAAKYWADPDLIHATRVGTPIDPRRVNRMWAEVCKRAGVSIRVHDLRHLAASLAFAEGASVREVQEMLRHRRESTTSQIYVHVMESVRRGTAARMDSALRKIMGQ